jgi:hypothetical protein
MLTPIELHDQTAFRAAEAGNETTNGMLSPELCTAHLSVAQPCPEPSLDFRLLTTEAADAISKC